MSLGLEQSFTESSGVSSIGKLRFDDAHTDSSPEEAMLSELRDLCGLLPSLGQFVYQETTRLKPEVVITDSRVELTQAVTAKLVNGVHDVCVEGMSGGGKTTIAKSIVDSGDGFAPLLYGDDFLYPGVDAHFEGAFMEHTSHSVENFTGARGKSYLQSVEDKHKSGQFMAWDIIRQILDKNRAIDALSEFHTQPFNVFDVRSSYYDRGKSTRNTRNRRFQMPIGKHLVAEGTGISQIVKWSPSSIQFLEKIKLHFGSVKVRRSKPLLEFCCHEIGEGVHGCRNRNTRQ